MWECTITVVSEKYIYNLNKVETYFACAINTFLKWFAFDYNRTFKVGFCFCQLFPFHNGFTCNFEHGLGYSSKFVAVINQIVDLLVITDNSPTSLSGETASNKFYLGS